MGQFTVKKHSSLTEEADLHTPKLHASRHEDGGDDEIDVSGLTGGYSLSDLQSDHPDLSGSQLHDPKAHVSSHESAGADALTLANIDSLACRIKVGTYTGDGTTSQAITGIGFQTKFVWVFDYTTDTSLATDPFVKVTGMYGDRAYHRGYHCLDNRLISLDADGFTVDDDAGDQHPNKDGQTYVYIALG